jgi:putative tricarboxylic transport membrane protein
MKNPNLISGLVLTALAVLLFRETASLTYMTRLGPGPGFFPYWLSILLGLIACGIVIQSLRTPAIAKPDSAPPVLWRSLATLAVLALAALAFEIIGFRLTIFLMLFTLLPLFGYRQPIGIATLAIAGSVGGYALFHTLLKAPLPTGWYGI